MRHLSWIITIPLLVIAVVFAVNHRERVTLDFWPLPLEVATPLYLLVLLVLFVGFLIGGSVVWRSQGRHRRRARERRYRIEDLEREVNILKRGLDRTEAEGRAAQQPTDGRRDPALPSARTGT